MKNKHQNKNYPQGQNKKKFLKLPVKVGRADFNKYIDPFLSQGSRGPKTKLSRYKIFNYILYVLHTGMQWDELKTKRNEASWQAIYHHHNKWSKDGSYQNLFETSIMFLRDANCLDLSAVHGDGSNTVAKKGANKLATRDTSTRKD